MSQSTELPKEILTSIVKEAILYCNNHHKGGCKKYIAALDSYEAAATAWAKIAIGFAEWKGDRYGLWFDEEYRLWNKPDFETDDEYQWPEDTFRWTTEELLLLYLKTLPQ